MSFANSMVLLLLAVAVVGLTVWSLVSTGLADRKGTRVVVRCLGGHVFTTMWPPSSRWNPMRAGVVRWRYCPAGEHWTLVTPVRPEDLSPAEWQMARHCHDDSVRCSATIDAARVTTADFAGVAEACGVGCPGPYGPTRPRAYGLIM